MAETRETATEEKFDTSRVDGARGAMMVVATLVATVIYASALSPPGGVWAENSYTARAGSFNCTLNTSCIAGTAVLAYSDTKSYVGFVTLNAFALCYCLVAIILLLGWYTFDISPEFLPYGLFMSLLVVLVGYTYLSALEMLTPKFVLDSHDMHQTVRTYKEIMGTVTVLIGLALAVAVISIKKDSD